MDTSGKHSLEELRSYQDWYLRYYLKSVPGVAEVAPLGGFVRQYQVNVDPNRLQAYGIPISRVVEAVRGGNNDVGGRLVEFGGTEYMVRGRGYARSIQDFENIVLTASEDGTPIRVKDIGQVVVGPDLRRGVTDLDGNGGGGLRNRGHAAGRKRPGCHRPGQGQDQGDRTGAAQRRQDRSHL